MSIDLSYTLSEKPVLVIGTAGIDVVGILEDDLNRGASTQARILSTFGGVGRNVAENLARLGQDVRLMTAVGDDYFGEQILANLNEAGVDISTSISSPGISTGAYLGVINPQGSMEYALDDLRAIEVITPKYIREHCQIFKDSSLLFIDANLPAKTLQTIMLQAKRTNLPVFADPASIRLASKLTPFLEQIDLLTANNAEAAVYCQEGFEASHREKAIEAAKHLVTRGVSTAIVTLAEFGVCYATSQTSGYIPAIRTEIADPTGAGDAMSAAVIFSLMNDIPLDDAIRLGVSAASLTLRYRGAVVPDLTLEMLYDQLII